MLKKIVLIVFICMLLLLGYIGILWFASLDSIMDKDGMTYMHSNVLKEDSINNLNWKIL